MAKKKKNFFLLLNNRLADELIRISEDRPESWVAMTHYSIMKNDLESAMAFIDRVIIIRNNEQSLN